MECLFSSWKLRGTEVKTLETMWVFKTMWFQESFSLEMLNLDQLSNRSELHLNKNLMSGFLQALKDYWWVGGGILSCLVIYVGIFHCNSCSCLQCCLQPPHLRMNFPALHLPLILIEHPWTVKKTVLKHSLFKYIQNTLFLALLLIRNVPPTSWNYANPSTCVPH